MKKVIKWTNKMSGETGFVKSASRVKGHFINTFNKTDAKIYKSDKQIENDFKILEEVGEMQNNNFEAVEA